MLCHRHADESHDREAVGQKPTFTEIPMTDGKLRKCFLVKLLSDSTRHPPDTVDVLDGVTDLPTHFFIVALHLREEAEWRTSEIWDI